MEDWQITHITKNLPKLISSTKFDWAVKAELLAENIIHQADVKKVDAVQKQDGEYEACAYLYQLLFAREGAYKVLMNALIKSRQTGASGILIRVPTELYSKPLTYLGISTELTCIPDVEIEVHGQTFKLNDFLHKRSHEVFVKIFQETIPEVEFYDTFVTKQKKLLLATNTIPPKPSYYVSRFISNRIKLTESIIKGDCTDVFVFRNTIKRYKLSQIVRPNSTADSTSQLTNITSRFIHLDENEDWIDLKKIAKGPIHLITYEANGNIFILEDTTAASDILTKLGSRNERVYMSEEDFVQQQLSTNCSSSRVCICDTPGMGKTFLLANIARHMTETSSGRIIVFTQLTSFANDFSSDFPDPETSLTNVLSYTCPRGQNLQLILKLVKSELLRLEIFFDAFDELLADKVEWAKQVFRSITTDYPTVTIYITSRPHMRHELEKSVGVVAYDILPFNHQNQVDFLVDFWQKNQPDSDLISLQRYATNCLEAVNNSLSKNDKHVAGIPLLCQLIAEIYANKAAFRSTKTRKFSNVPLQISGMYKLFILKRIELVAKYEKEFKNFKLVHVWHALQLLFPKNDFQADKKLTTVKGMLTSPQMLRIGILQEQPNGALEFIHRTFAEYLVAEYFTIKLQDDEMRNSEEMGSSSMAILTLLLDCNEHGRGSRPYEFLHPVIVSFFNSVLGEVGISEEMKIQADTFISSVSHEQLICVMCGCCQNILQNIFSLLGDPLAKWEKSLILQCFSNANSYKLLLVCIEESTNQMFHSCIHLLTEILKLDLAQINTYDKQTTLLQIAVFSANYEAVEYFVDRIPLETQELLKRCVLESDYVDKRENILNLLHNKNPSLIQETSDILLQDQIDVRFIKILVEFGANLSAVNVHGENCVMIATKFSFMPPSDFHELVQFLLNDCKAEYLFLENDKWEDPLPFIIKEGSLMPQTLKLLLSIPGIDINMKDKYGENLLFSATQGNKVDNFKQLVNRGLDCNAKGRCNRSLLHAAVECQEVEMVNHLLSLKLNPNSQDESGQTPLHIAAPAYGGLSFVEILVENGANLQAKNIKGETALHLSAANEYFPTTEAIKYLIGKGVGVNALDNDGNTPLHLCKIKENKDSLIEMGADICAKNKKGETPAQINPDLWKSSD